jgi:hypothetical protein
MRIFVPTLGDRCRLSDSNSFLVYLASHGYEVFLVSERPLPDGPYKVVKLRIPPSYDGPLGGALTYKRQWIENHLDVGEWACSVDDGVKGIAGLNPTLWPNRKLDWHGDKPAGGWGPAFNQLQPHSVAVGYLKSLVAECKRVGTVYGGFTSLNAPLYRLKRYAYRAVVCSRLCVFTRDTDCPWTHEETRAPITHDGLKTFRVVRKYSAVVLDRWGKPDKKSYTPGGLGPRRDRIASMEYDAKIYLREFGSMLKLHPKQRHMLQFRRQRRGD